MNWIRFYTNQSKIIVLCVSLFSVTESFSKNVPLSILWPEQATSYHGHLTGATYIQAGAFKSKSNALSFKNQLQARIRQPVTVQYRYHRYTVLVGPMRTVGQLHQTGLCISKRTGQCSIKSTPALVKKPVPYTRTKSKVVVVQKPQPIKVSPPPIKVSPPPQRASMQESYPAQEATGFPFDWDSTPDDAINAKEPPVYQSVVFKEPINNWFVAAELGWQKGAASEMTVNNGSGFPPPSNMDIYTAQSNRRTSIGLGAGYRWQRDKLWVPQVSLGLRYKYLFEDSIEGQVIQYSLPQFTNYDYKLNTTSNALLLSAKVDVYAFKNIMPYLGVGLGAARNQASYSETALPGITPRISPQFADQSNFEMSYTLGFGLDARLTDSITFSAGYEFQDWGGANTGNGTVGWSDQSLSQSNYQSHALLLSMDYLFNQ